MGLKTIFDLKLPKGSKCISLATLDPLCIAAAFDVPEIGVQVFILNPETGKCIQVEYPSTQLIHFP